MAGLARCEATNLGVVDLCHILTCSEGAVQIRVGLELAELRQPQAFEKFS